MKKTLWLFVFLSVMTNVWAQKSNKIDLKEGNIAEKFDRLYQKSGRYKQYKVVEHRLLLQLKKIVLDSLNKEKSVIAENNAKIEELKHKIEELQKEIQASKNEVESLEMEKNSIGFLGAAINKSKFKTIMWLLVFGLLAGLAYFIYAFKNSNLITKTARENLDKLEEEYSNFRTMALEREQSLKRQLIDERKKQQAS